MANIIKTSYFSAFTPINIEKFKPAAKKIVKRAESLLSEIKPKEQPLKDSFVKTLPPEIYYS